MLRKRRDGPGAEVREWADVEDDAAICELGDEAGVLDGPDPVPEPVCAQSLERAAHRGRTGHLSRMGHRRQAERLGERERRRVRLRWELRLQTAEPHGDDSPLTVLG